MSRKGYCATSLSRVSRSELHRQTVDLSAMAETLVSELRQGEPNRQVRVMIAPSLTLEADFNLLRIAMANLLANAWKFTSKQSAAVIEVGATDAEGERAYFVRDNGAGFDMAYADKLFGAFQRLHADHDFPGTGIGLATVQRIVRRHGGHVWVKAELNQGATFYFTIPSPPTWP